ncbi:hypothetical protein BKA62DRAFT_608615, partial [Auriculariales sp. MPI-PUGE-AT-0066]
KDFDVPHTTLRSRILGARSIKAFNNSKKNTTDKEEELLKNLALVNADRGFGLDRAQLHSMAQSIVAARDPSIELGVCWVDRFIDRHTE